MNWLAAGLLIVVLGTAYYLDWPSEIEAAQDAVSAYKSAKTEQERQDRFDAAAQALCGENAAWRLLSDGAVQCFTHRGFKTKRAAL
jgi:hypothetical protein